MQSYFVLTNNVTDIPLSFSHRALSELLHFEVHSREPFYLDYDSELAFYTIQEDGVGKWKSFSSLYHEETLQNFASANLNNNLTIIKQENNTVTQKDLSCSRWMLLNHINNVYSEMDLCRRVRDGCHLSAYFLERGEMNRVPNQCLSCSLMVPKLKQMSSTEGAISNNYNNSKIRKNDNNQSPIHHQKKPPIARFGTRRIIYHADQAQVVFVLDGSCHQPRRPAATLRFMNQISRLANVVEREFRLKQIRSKFMVIFF